MRIPKHHDGRLMASINIAPLAAVLMVVTFAVMFSFPLVPVCRRVSAELPKVNQAVSMRGALREDALMVTVMRDGKIFFGGKQVSAESLSSSLQQDKTRLDERVYVRADARARYRTVKKVIDSVREAGLSQLAILAEPLAVRQSWQ
jgi:biopolymer transport protein TolR